MADHPRPIKRRRRRLRAFSVLRMALLLVVYGISFAGAALYHVATAVNADLPNDLTKLLDYQPNRSSVVLSQDGEEIGAFSFENRTHRPTRAHAATRARGVPVGRGSAFLRASRLRSIRHRARGVEELSLRQPIKQGGSTLTQQIIKQTLLANEEGDLSDLGLAPDESRAGRSCRSTPAR